MATVGIGAIEAPLALKQNLRHRVAITYEAEAGERTSETVSQKIFDELPVP